ncbi:DUF4157 domain-containing protein [Frankia sp. CiP3]|uniref:eCIS core domain-containing protein n=1 Tax=Frankia sp. CiP3 TaxID=2880971 RepID=UPI001EF40B05|nr:DUF4157 domain-containing protein [Frankia sp. CiP3]
MLQEAGQIDNADGGHGQSAGSSVHAVLRSSGRSLPEPVRAEMEARLGSDFSDVRLHTDPVAQRSATELGARAYTSGSHVVIGRGGADEHTLAHELIHVTQQRQGTVMGTDDGSGLKISDPSDRFERAAEETARQVMSAPAPLQQTPGTRTHSHSDRGGDVPVQRVRPSTKPNKGKNAEVVKPSGSSQPDDGGEWHTATEEDVVGGSKAFKRELGKEKKEKNAPEKGRKYDIEFTKPKLIGPKQASGEPQAGPAFVATVPVRYNTNLTDLIEKYKEATKKQNGNFALVLGVNCGGDGSDRGTSRTKVDEAIKGLGEPKGLTFPIAVIGFIWINNKKSQARDQLDQKNVPYGLFREILARHRCTTDFIEEVRARSKDGVVYLHTGDSDVHSLKVPPGKADDSKKAPSDKAGGSEEGPSGKAGGSEEGLFDKASEILSGRGLEPKSKPKSKPKFPDLASGGYTVPSDSGTARNAAELDIKVREAMAGVDPRSVYFPEPNTFIKVPDYGHLPDSVSFGIGAKEGQQLADDVRKYATNINPAKDNKEISVFDTRLMITTNADRIAGKIDEKNENELVEVCKLAQSHANRKTWSDQMEHYLDIYHAYTDQRGINKLTELTFQGLRVKSGDDIEKLEPFDKIVGNLKSDPKYNQLPGEAWNLAEVTRNALINKLKEIHEESKKIDSTNAQKPPTAGPSRGKKQGGAKRS